MSTIAVSSPASASSAYSAVNPSVPNTENRTLNTVIKVGVTAVIFDSQGRVLLGRKGRAFCPDLINKWVTPGGRVNFGETLHTAIVREVKEETGLVARVSGTYWPQDLIHENEHFVFFVFLMQILRGTAAAGDDLVELRWCDQAQLNALRSELTPLTKNILKTVI